jgi:hypothetical protein
MDARTRVIVENLQSSAILGPFHMPSHSDLVGRSKGFPV